MYFVYWNLHKGMWSVKALDGPNKGRVIDRVSQIVLADVRGKVSEAGRQRVLREGRKNVHAGLVGRIATHREKVDPDVIEWIGDRITYNPRKYKEFVHVVDESPFEGSAYALLTANRQVFVA